MSLETQTITLKIKITPDLAEKLQKGRQQLVRLHDFLEENATAYWQKEMSELWDIRVIYQLLNHLDVEIEESEDEEEEEEEEPPEKQAKLEEEVI